MKATNREGWKRRAVALCVVMASISFGLSGCGKKGDGAGETPHEGKPRIVATSTMLTDLVKALAGDDAEVAGLMAPGVDPHTYEMPARAIAQIRGSDAVFYNGFLLEGKMADVLEPMAAQGKAVVAVAEALPRDQVIQPENFEGHADPHVWGDVQLWKQTVPTVREALQHLMPEKADAIAARADAYSTELDALDAWIRERIALVPEANRLLVTSHDAFTYFGRAYGFEVIGVQGISTAADAGIADIVNTVDLVKSRGVKAIFVESSVSRATIERIAKDAGVVIGGELYSDSCGPAGEMETAAGETYDKGTYIGMMKHNVNAMVEALK